MDIAERRSWRQAVVDLLARTRLAQPDELAAELNAAVAGLGIEMTIYLVDQEQRMLHPVPRVGQPDGEPLLVDATVAGRAFMAVEATPGSDKSGRRLWIPLVDGSERLGVLEVLADAGVADTAAFRRDCDMIAALVGHLLVIKSVYGDDLVRVRRTERMSVASELLWQLLPPLTYACHRFVVSAVLEPCYHVGGDGFDYAVGRNTAFMTVLDTAGHGLPAGLGTAVALAAIRAARRAGQGLYATARAVDEAFAGQDNARFTTGVLTELNLDTGVLRYINAGHPPPLILRGSKVVARLDGGGRMPLGVDDPQIEVAEVVLQPGDRLLCYTDGVTEARDHAGEEFGEQRLVDLAEWHAAAGLPAPETLRRLSHAVLAHLAGPPADDATLLLMEWSHAAAERVVP